MGQITQAQTKAASETLKPDFLRKIIGAARCSEPVSGLTHNFYRYPARFSPHFARAAILAFTNRGDTVFDPFMGGGTTLVEASALGRSGVGTDINPLAVFVARVKTTPLSESDLLSVRSWADALLPALNLHRPPLRATTWTEDGYQRNIADRLTWPTRKTLELALAQVETLGNLRQREFARCALLRTGQWALDCRARIPCASQFRRQFSGYLQEMIEGARRYARTLAEHQQRLLQPRLTSRCVTRSAVGVEADPELTATFPPTLILTSPPYPGVHVLYHRWQVQGRRETPAPFWVIGSLDGCGECYYTFGDRKARELSSYYEHMYAAYRSLARVSSRKTVLVQLVAFSEPSWQLPKFLDVMTAAGFQEERFPSMDKSVDFRIWRAVPNRKWYAQKRGQTKGSIEVVLFHHLA